MMPALKSGAFAQHRAGLLYTYLMPPTARADVGAPHPRPAYCLSPSLLSRVSAVQMIKGNVLSGTVLGCFGCFWLSWGLCQYWILVLGVPPLTGGSATGYTLYLVLWGVLASGFFVVTLATNYCLQVRWSVRLMCPAPNIFRTCQSVCLSISLCALSCPSLSVRPCQEAE